MHFTSVQLFMDKIKLTRLNICKLLARTVHSFKSEAHSPPIYRRPPSVVFKKLFQKMIKLFTEIKIPNKLWVGLDSLRKYYTKSTNIATYAYDNAIKPSHKSSISKSIQILIAMMKNTFSGRKSHRRRHPQPPNTITKRKT